MQRLCQAAIEMLHLGSMTDQSPQTETNAPKQEAQNAPLDAPDASDKEQIKVKSDLYFSKDIQLIIDKAEALRMERMKQYETRGFLSFSLGMFFTMAGGCIFAWFFFVQNDILKAIMGLIAGMTPSYLLHQFKLQPIKNYKREHKEVFMPALARALGGLRYRANSGIKINMIRPSRILPAHGEYKAEDCFHGKHNGIKMIMSEARMKMPSKQGKGYAFDGIFVLLELPKPSFTGQTLIMGNIAQARKWGERRWGDLSYTETEDPGQESHFDVYSNNHEEAKKLARGDILERLHVLAKEFDNAKISLSFYKQKYVFLMIPYSTDMFEHSSLYLPITTKEDALTRKREIEQIISIIDTLSLHMLSKKTDEKPVKTPDTET